MKRGMNLAKWSAESLRASVMAELKTRGLLSSDEPLRCFVLEWLAPPRVSSRSIEVRLPFDELSRTAPSLLKAARTYEHLNHLGERDSVVELLLDYLVEALFLVRPDDDYVEWSGQAFVRIGASVKPLPPENGPYSWHVATVHEDDDD